MKHLSLLLGMLSAQCTFCKQSGIKCRVESIDGSGWRNSTASI